MKSLLSETRAQPAQVKAMAPFVRGVACAIVSLHMALTFAQVPAATSDLIHQVQAGDTLYFLAERYTGQSNHWPQLQKLNRIADPYQLVPGTQVRIPAKLLGSSSSVAMVVYVTGEVLYTLPGQTRAQALPVGTRLPEGTRIEVGANGFLRLQMPDDSVARLPAGSRAQLTLVRHQEATHTTRTIIQMEAGRIDATVTPKRSKSSKFEIHTPLAVASVRGTEFGVAIQPDATVTSEVTHGVVELRGLQRGKNQPSGRSQPLQADQGARVDTSGTIGPVRTLPPAPNLSVLPGTVTDADFVHLPLPSMPGIEVYQVRIASDEALEQVVRNGTIRGESAQFAGLADGNYMVGMRAVNDIGLLGQESRQALRIKARPIAPLFQRPASNEKIASRTVELTCTQAAEAQRFRLQIARDESFQTPVVDETGLTECRLQVTLPPGKYFWRLASVRLAAGGAPDQGPFSASRRFELSAPPPQAPIPVVNSDDEALAVHWAGVPGYRYLLQVADDENFSRLVYNETRPDTQLTLPSQTPGTYYLRIQAIDAQGQVGTFSSTQRIQVGGVLRSSYGDAVRDADNKAVGRQ